MTGGSLASRTALLVLNALTLALLAGGLAHVVTSPTTPWLESGAYAALPPPLRPYRPLWFGTLNAVLDATAPSWLLRIDAEDLKRGAVRRVGFADFQDDEVGSFAEGLRRVCDSLERESALTPMGRVITRAQMEIWVENRLKIARAFASPSAAAALPRVRAPVFVVGMPRSGTTFLHNLLSLDEASFRAPRLWEVTDPVPALGLEGREWERSRRTTLAWLGTEAFKSFARNVHAAHPIHYMNAEECMPILSLNTLSNVTSYNEWLMEQDQSRAMRWHERFLRVLQSGVERGQRQQFLLKAPWHMNHLDAVLRQYPDAWIVAPHRDPSGMLTSLSSLHARFYGVTSDRVDPVAIGAYQRRMWDAVMRRYLAARKRATPEQRARMIDLKFADLRSDPIAQVRVVYRHLGLELRPDVELRMRQWLSEDVALGKQGAAGEHRYDPHWFGLDPREIMSSSAFAEYAATYV